MCVHVVCAGVHVVCAGVQCVCRCVHVVCAGVHMVCAGVQCVCRYAVCVMITHIIVRRYAQLLKKKPLEVMDSDP